MALTCNLYVCSGLIFTPQLSIIKKYISNAADISRCSDEDISETTPDSDSPQHIGDTYDVKSNHINLQSCVLYYQGKKKREIIFYSSNLGKPIICFRQVNSDLAA